jgi:chorismate lyase
MIWHPAPHWKSQISANLYRWLFDSTSLTQRLQTHCQQQFFVEVLEETWENPLAAEKQALQLSTSLPARIRHVYLHCREQTWVFARTVIPTTTLVGAYRDLETLGTQPLGEILFSFHALQRTDIEVACLSPAHRLYQLASVDLQPKPEILWARRSIFYLPEDKPLLVHEVFLPNMLEWLETPTVG